MRGAARLYAKNVSSAGLIRSVALPRAAITGRRYISESKADAAIVNVDSAIKADQKKFFKETGINASEQPMQGTAANADAMMDPMAGMSKLPRASSDCPSLHKLTST